VFYKIFFAFLLVVSGHVFSVDKALGSENWKEFLKLPGRRLWTDAMVKHGVCLSAA